MHEEPPHSRKKGRLSISLIRTTDLAENNFVNIENDVKYILDAPSMNPPLTHLKYKKQFVWPKWICILPKINIGTIEKKKSHFDWVSFKILFEL